MSCNHNCNQGRSCDCHSKELHVTMEDNPFDMDWMLEMMRDLLAVIGFFGMIVLIGVFFGYMS